MLFSFILKFKEGSPFVLNFSLRHDLQQGAKVGDIGTENRQYKLRQVDSKSIFKLLLYVS